MWALIENDVVVGLTDVDPEGRFPEGITWEDVSKVSPSPEMGWSYVGGEFSPPPPPSNEDLASAAQSLKVVLMSEAAKHIAPLQDAVDLGMATEEEEAALLAWKRYRVLLSRIDQQADYPVNIEWPEMPVAG